MDASLERQAGTSLFEALVVLALIACAVAFTVGVAVPWLGRESLRSATHDLRTALELDRMEAVKRNRPCRFVLDTTLRSFEVWDGMGTAGSGDDVLLRHADLPATVQFVDPQGGAPVTFAALGGTAFQVVFNADGTVGAGEGAAFLSGGGIYRKLSLEIAGGMRVTRWTGTAWQY